MGITRTLRYGDDVIAANRRDGSWRNRTIAEDLDEHVARQPERVPYSSGSSSYTYAELHRVVSSLAAALSQRGVRHGDVISFQLPNWIEAAAVDLAAAMLGAISNPIATIYRFGELRKILADSGSKVFFVPGTFRNFDYLANARQAVQDLHPKPLLILVGPGSEDASAAIAFSDLVSEGANARWARPRVAPDSYKLVMYTSGTTGASKGVLHTHETSARGMKSFADALRLTAADIMFMPSTVTHATGYVYGLQMPLIHDTATVFMDHWVGSDAHRLINEHGCTVTVGAVPFLADLIDVIAETGNRLPTLRYFGCGGAAVTPAIIRKGAHAFRNAKVFRLYGSTETANVTAGFVADGEEHLAAETDGKITDYEVKIVDGEIAVRGPGLFSSYTSEAETETAFDADGYFYTGDVGVVGEQGSLTITGRKKDIIIRGGYNISAKEIEDALQEHPMVREVAVVGKPEPRLGETICAVVILASPTDHPTVDDFARHLASKGLARQKYPQDILLVDDFPRTPAGKVKKFVLRQQLRDASSN